MSLPNYAPVPFQRRRTRPWIVLGSSVGVLVFAALVTGAVFIALHTFFQQTDQPVPVAASYYLAFMRQDYPKAYAELDSQATINGQQVDEQTFRHLATTADAQQGKVTGYSLDGSDSASLFTVTVHRGGQNYMVHLQFKLEGSGWKIISADGI
jgi:hypothetical protein